jgi:type III pantothenate kinase
MILEVDCGNTRIKWRVLDRVKYLVSDFGAANDLHHFVAQMSELPRDSISFVRAVSVRGDAETQALLEALVSRFSVDVKFATSSDYLAGAKNGYKEPQLLGADRWMAIAGAYALTNTACLVLDVGTAVTSDFVSADGVHLGGFICPGIRLMREQLTKHACRINFEPRLQSGCNSPGKTTAEAVECGTQLMLTGFVETQVKKACEFLGERFTVVITGGDAHLVAASLPVAMVVPDLVFSGLALAFPD